MKTKTTTEKFTSKLGTSKGVKRARIWLQGNRLLNAGFKPGYEYTASWQLDKLVLSMEDQPNSEIRKVSGKGDMPIIDIVGAAVTSTFGFCCDRVDVTFTSGKIVITRHRADERPKGA